MSPVTSPTLQIVNGSAMNNTGLLGPYHLTFDGIDAAVDRKSAGVYALGHSDPDGRFVVRHIGRSDEDIKSRLCDYIGSDVMFKYRYFASPKQAFLKECELFHTFSPPGNRIHPDRSRDANWECPYCRIYGWPR